MALFMNTGAEYDLRRNVRYAGILHAHVCCSQLVCSTSSNDLDSPGTSLSLCQCCPFQKVVCSRTPLVLSPYAHPKAWQSRSHA